MKTGDSKLLARLDAALAASRDPLRTACLRAERAGYRAREGHFDEARAELDALRADSARRPHPELSVWLCLVEGWLAYYRAFDASARGWFKRAHALSQAGELARVHALSAGWLALGDYAAGDSKAMVEHVAEALRTAEPDDHAARARACVVAALAHHFAEDRAAAQAWYLRAREHARHEGDEQMLSAINHNIAAHDASHAMQAAVFGSDAEEIARRALAAAEATGNYDEWIGTESLDALVPMMMAVLWSVRGEHAKALAIYERHMQAAREQGLERMSAIFLADVAWCRWHAGARDAAAAELDAAQARLADVQDPDDLAVARGRIAQLLALMGREEESLAYRDLADAAWREHRVVQQRMRDALAALPAMSLPGGAATL